ncbi:hypothetical protein [Bradyrhizobium sp. JR3.5]
MPFQEVLLTPTRYPDRTPVSVVEAEAFIAATVALPIPIWR